ncbi:unnamed protein product [Ranitomeya imitator]|uniref:All-trans-retinol 13,14-reductase n=1 Tax=Ranitomeya imitator TaxID=111125 RepID=A0ABN9MJR7_9NEOB|nr:unnamed protein product [Ranitomeya imitator]
MTVIQSTPPGQLRSGFVRSISRSWSGLASLQSQPYRKPLEGVESPVAKRKAKNITALEEICMEEWANIPTYNMWLYVIAGVILIFIIVKSWLGSRGPNPFAVDTRRPPGSVVFDKAMKRKVIKNVFSPEKVPDKLDAIVIGSGIGGQGVAALLARAGKRVLVLEQLGKLGGCCHTFNEKGYEFDVGIHYIGQLK